MLRKAFTLIELVFAIVVIGISVLSLPMMSQVIATNVDKSLAQEAILIASTDITKIISGPWDHNSKQPTNDYENVLIVSNDENNTFGPNNQRSGNVNIIYDSNRTLRPSTTLGLETGETLNDISTEKDIDDYISGKIDAVSESGTAKGYKQKYKKEVNVSYVSRGVTSTNTTLLAVDANNVKKVEVIIYDKDEEKLVYLYTYEANTGSPSTHPSRGL